MRAIFVIGDNKICTKCNVEKKCEDYSIKRKSPDGRENVCKKCRNESQKERRKKDKMKNKYKTPYMIIDKSFDKLYETKGE